MGAINTVLGAIIVVAAIPCFFTYTFRSISVFFKMLTIFGKDPDEIALRTGRMLYWEVGLVIAILIVGQAAAFVVISLGAFFLKVFHEDGMDRARHLGYSVNKLGKPINSFAIYIALLCAKGFVVLQAAKAVIEEFGDMKGTVESLTAFGPLGSFIPEQFRLILPFILLGILFYSSRFKTSRSNALERRAKDRSEGRRKVQNENKGYKADEARGRADSASGGGREEW